jgi:hypothetical protein
MPNEKEPDKAMRIDARKVDEIARALGTPLERAGGEEEFDLVVRNEPLALALRLRLSPQRSQVSIYLRGQSAFLGFLVLTEVTDVEVRPEEGRVDFLSKGGGHGVRLSVLRSGNFFMENGPGRSGRDRART